MAERSIVARSTVEKGKEMYEGDEVGKLQSATSSP